MSEADRRQRRLWIARKGPFVDFVFWHTWHRLMPVKCFHSKASGCLGCWPCVSLNANALSAKTLPTLHPVTTSIIMLDVPMQTLACALHGSEFLLWFKNTCFGMLAMAQCTYMGLHAPGFESSLDIISTLSQLLFFSSYSVLLTVSVIKFKVHNKGGKNVKKNVFLYRIKKNFARHWIRIEQSTFSM